LERYQSLLSDPQLCLDWEGEAIAELNSCYTDAKSAAVFTGLPDADIRKLVDLFRISDDYYSPAVDATLVELVRAHDEALASEVMRNHTLSSRQRIILCIRGTKHLSATSRTTPSPEDFVAIATSMLAPDERSYFHYAGSDQLVGEVGGFCYNRSGDGVNGHSNNFHMVTWFTAGHSHADVHSRRVKYTGSGFRVNGVLFELTTTRSGTVHSQREVTQCGDGVRQISESCDFTGNYPSCTMDCEVREGHDCDTGKLEPSKCWKESCGDGLRTRGEECDDGNSVEQDGCSNSCRIETTYKCSQTYNSTSRCTQFDSIQAAPAVPARLLSQQAGTVVSREESSVEDKDERTVSSGNKPTMSSILLITLVLVGISTSSLR
jgi:cysteine-rich repeat protein